MLMISINKKKPAPTQLNDMPFNSMVVFNGVALGAGKDGIHSMDVCNAVGIDAYIEIPLSDFGLTAQKRVRRVYLSGEFKGTSMIIKTKNDEVNERSYTATSNNSDEDSLYANIGRDGKGRHWSFRIENIDGNDFSIDSISIIPVILNRRR